MRKIKISSQLLGKFAVVERAKTVPSYDQARPKQKTQTRVFVAWQVRILKSRRYEPILLGRLSLSGSCLSLTYVCGAMIKKRTGTTLIEKVHPTTYHAALTTGAGPSACGA